jgi:N6-adenosine-specific RNA methylase IME4/ParB-like chromosome segregation protein Spo0J
VQTYEFHPLANIFPLIEGQAFEDLKADIQAHGVREPIWIYQGQILDGRNRYRAAKAVGAELNVKQWEGDEDGALSMVLSLNLKRRQLTPGQLSFVALSIEEYEAELAKKRQGSRSDIVERIPQSSDSGKARAKAAAAVGVNDRYVQDAKRIAAKAPELVEQIQAGTMTIPEAIKEIKKEERKVEIAKQREDIEQGEIVAPTGLFDVVSVDPPWNYGREYDPDGSRVANPYPEMNQEQIKAIELPVKDDAVLFLWTTHQFLFDAKELLDHWGFTYKATMVWDKERIGMGAWLRMQCEFCLVGIKGKPFWENTEHRDIIREARREHSRKPEAFYQIVEKITAGRRLEYFARSAHEGWEVFGNDTTKF